MQNTRFKHGALVGLVMAITGMIAGTAHAQTPSAEQAQGMQKQLADWPQLDRYRSENAALPPAQAGKPRVVFFGDSITEGWGKTGSATFFPGKPYVNRGISGQTTAQMVVRFRQDVIALKPAAVVILAGTNDIAGNTGPAKPEMIQDNLASMAQLAKANGIKVVLASILPASDYSWKPGLAPAPKIRALNAWIRQYAAAQDAVYLDYYTPLDDGQGGLPKRVSADGVHPNAAGYAVMQPLAEQAVKQALAQSQ
jgi:lysophospholipase L1-like esterase